MPAAVITMPGHDFCKVTQWQLERYDISSSELCIMISALQAKNQRERGHTSFCNPQHVLQS